LTTPASHTLTCVECGYPLLDVTLSAGCPECGTACRETLAQATFHSQSAPWLRKTSFVLRFWAILLVFSATQLTVNQAFYFWYLQAGTLDQHDQTLDNINLLCAALYNLLLGIVIWHLSLPDPSGKYAGMPRGTHWYLMAAWLICLFSCFYEHLNRTFSPIAEFIYALFPYAILLTIITLLLLTSRLAWLGNRHRLAWAFISLAAFRLFAQFALAPDRSPWAALRDYLLQTPPPPPRPKYWSGPIPYSSSPTPLGLADIFNNTRLLAIILIMLLSAFFLIRLARAVRRAADNRAQLDSLGARP
jgi:hypothetical protein